MIIAAISDVTARPQTMDDVRCARRCPITCATASAGTRLDALLGNDVVLGERLMLSARNNSAAMLSGEKEGADGARRRRDRSAQMTPAKQRTPRHERRATLYERAQRPHDLT